MFPLCNTLVDVAVDVGVCHLVMSCINMHYRYMLNRFNIISLSVSDITDTFWLVLSTSCLLQLVQTWNRGIRFFAVCWMFSWAMQKLVRIKWLPIVNECLLLSLPRLQMEALKQAAVDPSTGKIDISILTTGISGAARKRKAEIAQALRKMMLDKRQPTYVTTNLYDELKSQSDIVSLSNHQASLVDSLLGSTVVNQSHSIVCYYLRCYHCFLSVTFSYLSGWHASLFMPNCTNDLVQRLKSTYFLLLKLIVWETAFRLKQISRELCNLLLSVPTSAFQSPVIDCVLVSLLARWLAARCLRRDSRTW